MELSIELFFGDRCEQLHNLLVGSGFQLLLPNVYFTLLEVLSQCLTKKITGINGLQKPEHIEERFSSGKHHENYELTVSQIHRDISRFIKKQKYQILISTISIIGARRNLLYEMREQEYILPILMISHWQVQYLSMSESRVNTLHHFIAKNLIHIIWVSQLWINGSLIHTDEVSSIVIWIICEIRGNLLDLLGIPNSKNQL